MGRQHAPPPTDSGAQQVLWGLGDQPEIPWKCTEHVGSHIAGDCLRSQQGGRVHRDSNAGGLLACYIRGARVHACDNALTFQQNNWPHCGSIWNTSCCKDGFFIPLADFFIGSREALKTNTVNVLLSKWKHPFTANPRLISCPISSLLLGVEWARTRPAGLLFQDKWKLGSSAVFCVMHKKNSHILSVSVLYLTRNPISACS